MKELTISIVAIGPLGAGKTRATDRMVESLKEEFEIIAQASRQFSITGVETYTFRVRLR